uniref:C2H2-type domain-containing protein n=1 Tax=Denticeps clupeoides TaxID=299321 RepID=A0AAY4B2Q9_9TELE
MTDQIVSWDTKCLNDKIYISKRSIRKAFINKRHYVPCSPPESSGSGAQGANFSLSSEEDTNYSCGGALVYLKPDPSDDFSKTSSGEEAAFWTVTSSLGWPSCAIAEECPDDRSVAEDVHIERSGQSCPVGVDRNKASANLKQDQAPSLQASLEHDHEASSSSEEKDEEEEEEEEEEEPKSQSKADLKLPITFSAMKRRGVEGDTENRPYKCIHCNWAFKKSSNLLSHMETHSGLKPHVCELCGKAYSHQGTLQQHKRLHTGERPYRCPFCDKTYIWSSDFRKHIRTHTGEKPYACAGCGKDFVRSSDLRKHERNMHANDKPFPCGQCGKTFNKPLSLRRHERTHLGERPFACPQCGKAFAMASRMAEHQKVHSGVRPYECTVCGKTFTKSSNLLEHQTIHSGQRPHKCSVCGVAFAVASRLARHQRVHTGEQPYHCSGCDTTFRCPATLRRHQIHHCHATFQRHSQTPGKEPCEYQTRCQHSERFPNYQDVFFSASLNLSMGLHPILCIMNWALITSAIEGIGFMQSELLL